VLPGYKRKYSIPAEALPERVQELPPELGDEGRARRPAPYIFLCFANLATRSLIAFGQSVIGFPFSGRTRRSAPDESEPLCGSRRGMNRPPYKRGIRGSIWFAHLRSLTRATGGLTDMEDETRNPPGPLFKGEFSLATHRIRISPKYPSTPPRRSGPRRGGGFCPPRRGWLCRACRQRGS
jgi:hypothetical protein